MKVVCDRSALQEAVNLVSSVVSPRSPRPQLGCVKLDATLAQDVGELTLAATDGEVSIALTTTGVEVQRAGQALVPAAKLQQIIAAEDAEPTLTLETEQDALRIRGADAKFTIYGFPPDEFPSVATFPTGEEEAGSWSRFRAAGETLASLITRTLFATAKETSRYAINGVLLKREGRKMEMVATDGRRLALATGSVEGAADEPAASCILPSKALQIVNKLLPACEEAHVAIGQTQAALAFGSPGDPSRAVVRASLIEGAFPPYEDVIPRDQDKKATVETASFVSAIRRAALLTNEESRGVRMRFAQENGSAQATITSRAPELGEAEITTPLKAYTGEELEIGFNPAFILDALKAIEEPEAVFELKAANKPGVLRSGPDFLYVVMPVGLT
ncbi:MAG: DNA polymerase III subunit beta [Planctomycetota bacterium]|nr:MAG: DNA polymerase III subunit beta [Planctomycetota bacterium]